MRKRSGRKRPSFPAASVLCYVLLSCVVGAALLNMHRDGDLFRSFVFSLFSGLCTSLGGVIVFFLRVVTKPVLAFTYGTAISVMLLVSVFDMLLPAAENISFVRLTSAFMGGIAVFAILGRFVGDLERLLSSNIVVFELPTESKENHQQQIAQARSLKTAVLTAAVLTLHNLPEGMAVIVSSASSSAQGLAVAFGIAVHNVAEGMIIATPIYASTRSKSTALRWTFYSGISEPFGALLAIGVLSPVLNAQGIHTSLSAISGMMISVCGWELAPEALRHDRHYSALLGVLFGYALMACSWQVFPLL